MCWGRRSAKHEGVIMDQSPVLVDLALQGGGPMARAPFMALVIGLVAACEGLKVKGSAESLGRQRWLIVPEQLLIGSAAPIPCHKV